ncbi:hypothetical protein NKI51_27705 [Mesorhizobium australicum]|uniref:hypothetical protein n=1 Tax=Mesorhizobium australicum TaxID=536018 RepID=UPI00333C4D68
MRDDVHRVESIVLGQCGSDLLRNWSTAIEHDRSNLRSHVADSSLEVGDRRIDKKNFRGAGHDWLLLASNSVQEETARGLGRRAVGRRAWARSSSRRPDGAVGTFDSGALYAEEAAGLEIPAIVKRANRKWTGCGRNLNGDSHGETSLDGLGKNDLANDRTLGRVQDKISHIFGRITDRQNAPNRDFHNRKPCCVTHTILLGRSDSAAPFAFGF